LGITLVSVNVKVDNPRQEVSGQRPLRGSDKR